MCPLREKPMASRFQMRVSVKRWLGEQVKLQAIKNINDKRFCLPSLTNDFKIQIHRKIKSTGMFQIGICWGIGGFCYSILKIMTKHIQTKRDEGVLIIINLDNYFFSSGKIYRWPRGTFREQKKLKIIFYLSGRTLGSAPGNDGYLILIWFEEL